MRASFLPSNLRSAIPLILLCSMLLIAAPGCSGCFGGNTAAKKKKEDEEKKKRKPDFEVGRLRVQPSDETSRTKNAVKPGHWTVTTQPLLANHFEFPAELHAASVDRSGKQVRVEATQYQMTVSTPAPLPKGTRKDYEMTYFVPSIYSEGSETASAAWLHSQLRSRRGGREVADTMQPTTNMPDFQYYMVVLARDPSRYTALKRLDTVMPPSSQLDELADITYYRVLLPRVERGAPLPSHAMAWTGIAYLVWDGMDPSLITPMQQNAMLDWLHFGGQIVISAPASLDMLRGSFLDPYLPADKVKAVDLKQSDFGAINAHWSLVNQQTRAREQIELIKPIVGIEMKIRDGAVAIPNTGGLIVERMVGRGRIVASAFPLTSKKLKEWECYDSLWHNALLRRPRRKFSRTVGSDYTRVDFHGLASFERDPRLSTTLRMFSRDAQNMTRAPDTSREALDMSREGRHGPKEDAWHFGGHSKWLYSGVAGWNDRSGVANAARNALRRAAGITIPSAGFVLKVLVIYLAFLVPVNWGVFRLMGRVEWAWIAAPIIAVVGSVAVVRLAQLDIGFARARTEVAVLELHGDYGRGHLTRYTALYTSLSTTYDFVFSEQSAVAQPFPANLGYRHSQHAPTYTVNYRRDKQVVLSGFTVASNKTGMVHSEHMFQLEGGVAVTGDETSGYQVENASELNINEAGVLRGTESGVEIAYLGELPGKSNKPLNFVPADLPNEGDLPIAEWRASKMLGKRQAQAGEVSLAAMAELGANSLQLAVGEMRLIGWTNAQLPGAEIRPAVRQTQTQTLILAHLTPGQRPEIQPDVNMRADFEERRVRTDDISKDGEQDNPGQDNPGQGASEGFGVDALRTLQDRGAKGGE